MPTVVPFGPRSLPTAWSLVQPLVSSPSILRDDVAAANALLVGRRSFEHADDGDVAVDRPAIVMPEAVVAAFLALAHLGVAAWDP